MPLKQSMRAPLHIKPPPRSDHPAAQRTTPKLAAERRSPRGGRVAELESKLAQALQELKKLKEQLRTKTDEETTAATDVYEVVSEETTKRVVEEEKEIKTHELCELKLKLANTEKKVASMAAENERLKAETREVEKKEEELGARLGRMGEELEEISARAERLKEELEKEERGKKEVEEEMRRLRMQAEQWRKAAETAAKVLAEEKEEEEEEEEGTGRRKGVRVVFGELWKKKSQHK